MTANEVSTDKLVTDLKRVVRDSEELLKDSAGAVGDKAHDLRERLSETLESAKATCRRLEEKAIEGAKATGTDRVELYTEAYAREYAMGNGQKAIQPYIAAATKANELGLGINAVPII